MAEEKTAEKKKSAFSGIIEKLKKVKHIEYYIIGVFAVIAIALTLGNFSFASGDGNPKQASNLFEYAKEQEARLEKALSQISGCGKVKVMITYSSGFEIVPAFSTDKTENKQDSGSGYTANITERTTLVMSGGKPLILKEIEPQVKGVVVIAQGAGNYNVKINLYKAVAALLKIDNSNIEIFTMK